MQTNIIKKRKKIKIAPFRLIMFIVLALYALSMITLFAWGLINSLKGFMDFHDNPLSFPKKLIFKNYAVAFDYFYVSVGTEGADKRVYIETMVWYSILYAGVGSLIQTFVSSITAYAAARYNKFFFSKVVYTIVIITMILPIIGSMPSEIQLLHSMHLFDTFIGMFILKANFLGLYFLVFHASFAGVPMAFSEAAKIDGASHFRIMMQIMYPMIKNIFFTVVLINFIGFWNDYMTPLVYLPSKPTMAYGLFVFSGSTIIEISSTPIKLAACMIMFVPIMIVFAVFQKQLMGNISMGGVKE